jgi:hypothetical protein
LVRAAYSKCQYAPVMTCSVEGCDRPFRAKGLCSTHWRRQKEGQPLDTPILDKRRGTPDERFDRKWVLDPDTGCHLWQDHLVSGYGQFRIRRGTQIMAHIYAYERAMGPVPDGMVLDHICHPDDGSCAGGRCTHRSCCNPEHVRPVSRGENTLRSATGPTAVNARRTKCIRGHELPPYVPGGGRRCQTCIRERVYPSWQRSA